MPEKEQSKKTEKTVKLQGHATARASATGRLRVVQPLPGVNPELVEIARKYAQGLKDEEDPIDHLPEAPEIKDPYIYVQRTDVRLTPEEVTQIVSTGPTMRFSGLKEVREQIEAMEESILRNQEETKRMLEQVTKAKKSLPETSESSA